MIANIIIGILIALLGYAVGDLLGEKRGRNGKCHDVTIEGMTFEGCEYKLTEEWQNVTVEVCKCRKCGAVDITWSKQPNTACVYFEEDSDDDK